MPAGEDLSAALERAVELLGKGASGLAPAAAEAASVDVALRGAPGVVLLVREPALADALTRRVAELSAGVVALEAALDAGSANLGGLTVEEVNAALVVCKDLAWAIVHDRLRTASAVGRLARTEPPEEREARPERPGEREARAQQAGEQEVAPGRSTIDAYLSVQLALSGLDRLEVRGRDSAGLHVLVTGHVLDLDDPMVTAALRPRLDDRLFTSRAVRVVEPASGGDASVLSFVYKAAAEIGELGDNGSVLRAAIEGDELLRRALSGPDVEATVLGHTRWASVGIISEANAHPLNSDESAPVPDRPDQSLRPAPGRQPYVTAALNGDVDNYVALREDAGLRIAPEVTTDAKVIPALIARQLGTGQEMEEAFRSTVATFSGSVAIAASAADTADELHLALRGSGQALYVGLAEDAFVVASEPYGVVEETSRYLRMDGETTGGQVVVLDRAGAGTLAGVRRLSYAGTVLPVTDAEVCRAEITTRDIDRAGYPHFLLKEITEAPASFRKTLRGRVVEREGRLTVDLGPDALPSRIVDRLVAGTTRRIVVIGQGTAAVAAQSVAASLRRCLRHADIAVSAALATELSGFELEDDMSDALVVAVSQSGTTTDTNRTVDLVRARGAAVLAIVNRRNSDLVERADGVIYNSDGRDVEMAVPSTKAFYAQVAAGFLLAVALGRGIGSLDAEEANDLLSALRTLPDAMAGVLARRPAIAAAAQLALPRRSWAVVGNGPNVVAANEVRIKLSELCYRSIACDVTEDKKHIDLSSEPLVLVCAAGLEGPNAADVAKEVAIYRAHKAVAVVISSDGEERFGASAAAVICVPKVEPTVAFVLSAMAGHLFGYEAALSIDAQARPLREGRAAIESVIAELALGDGGDGAVADVRPVPPQATSTRRRHPALERAAAVPPLLERLAPLLAEATRPFLVGLAAGHYDGNLGASTAVRLTTLLRYATGQLPLEAYEVESGKLGTPTALVDDVVGALTVAIDELTRPIDAIKHQAKTVTVGISRSEDALFGVPLVAQVLAIGARRDRLAYRALRTLAALDPAVLEVTGYTRYRIDGFPAAGGTIHVIDQGGSATGLRSRTDHDPALRGTKRRSAEDREVTVAIGRHDGRTVVIVPELKADQVVGLDLLHVRLAQRLDPSVAREVLSGYGYGPNRYTAIVDAVTETTPSFDDAVLASTDVAELLTQPVSFLADRWRS